MKALTSLCWRADSFAQTPKSIYMYFALCMLDNDHVLTFFTINFLKKKSFRNTIGVSNGLGPDQDRRYVGPDLEPNCFQR